MTNSSPIWGATIATLSINFVICCEIGNMPPRRSRRHGAGSRIAFSKTSLLDVGKENGLLAGIDWAATPDDVIEEFDPLLRKLGLPGFPASFHQFASEIEQAARGDHVGLIYPKLVDWASEHNLRVIDLNGGSDMCHFALVSPQLFSKWVGSKLSKQLKVEDPSWQFKK